MTVVPTPPPDIVRVASVGQMPSMRLVDDQTFRVHPNVQFRGPERERSCD